MGAHVALSPHISTHSTFDDCVRESTLWLSVRAMVLYRGSPGIYSAILYTCYDFHVIRLHPVKGQP